MAIVSGIANAPAIGWQRLTKCNARRTAANNTCWIEQGANAALAHIRRLGPAGLMWLIAFLG